MWTHVPHVVLGLLLPSCGKPTELLLLQRSIYIYVCNVCS